MCGINGICSSAALSDIGGRIDNMNHVLAHRGPDNDGALIIDSRTAFGHRRLAIIDISSEANQPMVSASGRWTIVFNGEIYNYRSLGSQLHHDFRTSSDTEVILAAVEERGLPWFLENCNGMFSIALHDRVGNRIHLVRDRLGIKPLYYFLDRNFLIFSSEIKGILNSGLVEANFNNNALDDYFAFRYVREPDTFFENIHQVRAGNCLTIDLSGAEFRGETVKYWDFPLEFNMEVMTGNLNEDHFVQELESRLTDAIKMRLISDVPLGTYLSGGIDSSLITAITALNSPKRVNTYNIGFPELNEFDSAALVAEKYGTCHHRIEMNMDDYLDSMAEIIGFRDSPMGVPNEVALAKMSRILRQDITVVLSGEGADELLGGYGRIYRSPFEYERGRFGSGDFYNCFCNHYEYVPRWLRDRYITAGKGLRHKFDALVSESFSHRCNDENVFRFFHEYHVKGLLQRVDSTTMLAGVEARVPFLDHELIEYVYRCVPHELKIRWKDESCRVRAETSSVGQYSEVCDIPKYLLRRMARSYLPSEIIDRKKMGFPVPLDNWYGKLLEMASEYLENAPWFRYDLWNEFISDLEKMDRTGQVLWMFINIEMFRRIYFKKSWRY
ncbi:MAG: asparagine synthase (glutamine-hydrolyzing) [Candidatus Wallbacteria bacterium HGW-Wallbacteria-1]|jgi:asparagine synthase (glutamine-hydrolysing)|uniref:asparagine synthase (glutamine-hydrolyzing) n=1 Tax=Candidatus Wallbacteria bacterium HGW-Wallbacteria-1 TaxID=2013854 RepID=A0A2N1PMM7_9BACT|nr:MAG: asparagine synthase (glutamine-hydrolyzing) [Candidatus Wallbacteria bacterium HGW-Wallbacteria-1]